MALFKSNTIRFAMILIVLVSTDVFTSCTKTGEADEAGSSSQKDDTQIEILTKEDLEQVFSSIDVEEKNNFGFVEFKKYIQGTFNDISDTDALDMFNGLDVDGNDQISLEEFKEFMLNLRTTIEEQNNDLKEAFSLYDKDKNGKINAEELFQTLKDQNHNIERHETPLMIANYDEDGDGCINFNEFKKMMQKKVTQKKVVQKK